MRVPSTPCQSVCVSLLAHATYVLLMLVCHASAAGNLIAYEGDHVEMRHLHDHLWNRGDFLGRGCAADVLGYVIAADAAG